MLKDEQIDGNKEMISYGLMNIAGSFTSCYLTTGESYVKFAQSTLYCVYLHLQQMLTKTFVFIFF